MSLVPRVMCGICLALTTLSFFTMARGQEATRKFEFDFRNGSLGWEAGFADYPPATDVNDLYELRAEIRALPPELGVGGTGFYFQGSNRSDDLFMFMKRRLTTADGIIPGHRYQVQFKLIIASDACSLCGGAGGTPGEGVVLKVGASPVEPLAVMNSNGQLRMNVDKGNQAVGGTTASVAGDIGNGHAYNPSLPFFSFQRTHQHNVEVTANANGELWLLVGTDSGFEGRTRLYYQRIEVTLVDPSGPTTIGLGSSTYTVAENDVRREASIVVNRSGDTSAPATVDYSTSDASGLKPCQSNGSVIASERCDYATQAGTLRFAAGETEKTIKIPVIDDAYQEPPESFTIRLSNAQGASLGSAESGITISDDDTQPPSKNPLDNQDFFIHQQYIDFLGRVAEDAGFAFWRNRMNNCPAGDVCDRVDTSKRFFESDEFQERGFFVYRLYDISLKRFPLYAEFIPEVARLNGLQTPAEQRQAKDAYLADFMSKTEFRTGYGTFINLDGTLVAGQATAFVDALSAQAGVTPANRQTLINNLASGAATPAQTLESFILQPEFSAPGTRVYDRARIVMQYFGYLRRDPEPGGFDFWWDQLTNPARGHVQDYRFMVRGFLQSDEYGFRFAPMSSAP